MIGIKITGANTTSRECANVMETAVSAGATYGIGYWAQVDEFMEGALPVLKLTDLEADARKTFTLTTVEIADAINQMLTDPEGTDSAGWTGRLLDDEYVDGPLADAIVQVACHGKVLYA